jgi:excisionase family DNA binding protein
MNEPDFLDLRQVAKLLQINYSTAWGLVSRAELAAFQVGRRWRVPRSSLEGFVEKRIAAAQQRALREIEAVNRAKDQGMRSSHVVQVVELGARTSVEVALERRIKELTARTSGQDGQLQ